MDSIKEMNAGEIFSLLKESSWITLDVREHFERSSGFLQGLHLPLASLEKMQDLIPRDKNILVYCRSGIRSKTAIRKLKALGFTKEMVNLTGGIMAVRQEEINSGQTFLQHS